MFKRSVLFSLSGLLLSCLGVASCTDESASEIEREIAAVERSLIPSVVVEGDSIPLFHLAERMDHYNVPGVSIAVLKDGEVRWAQGYGLANTETGQEVTTQTLFQAGSISKPLAALAVLKLWEEGRVDLDTDVNFYLKDWKVKDSVYTATEKVTLRRLLTHTAGMTVHGFPGYAMEEGFPGIIQVLEGEGNTPRITVDTIPGRIWRYSGGGYTVMQKVVEDVSGQSLEGYMRDHILRPMGLDESTYQQPLGSKYAPKASAAFNAEGEMLEGLWHNYPEQAAAGLWTTPSDLGRYCLEIQEIYGGNTDGILKPVTVHAMLTKHMGDWGLGPALQREGDSLLFGHGGKNAGFSNNMLAFAAGGDGMIVMTNADRGVALMGEIMRSISRVYGWGISNPRRVELQPQPADTLERYSGAYQLDFQVPDIGDYQIEVTLGEGTLEVFDPNNRERNVLSPLGPRKFIDLESGDEVEMRLKDGQFEILFNGRYRFQKLEE